MCVNCLQMMRTHAHCKSPRQKFALCQELTSMSNSSEQRISLLSSESNESIRFPQPSFIPSTLLTPFAFVTFLLNFSSHPGARHSLTSYVVGLKMAIKFNESDQREQAKFLDLLSSLIYLVYKFSKLTKGFSN